RDIKPENIMFKGSGGEAELRLIDFGCATMDEEKGKEHVTFAGTAFYISPEMFQKKYTTKTDVFSVGVVLYVLIAGYPAEHLQAAFNLLQKAKRDLKTLPGMPEDMPDTYYEMLDKLLVYRWKGRKSASEMLKDEFVTFHKALKKAPSKRQSMMRTQSVLLSGTGEKAAAAFGYTKFQRTLTTVLATMMDRGDIVSLMSKAEAHISAAGEEMDSKLNMIKVKDLKAILSDMGKSDVVAAIDKQKGANDYDGYSYEYTLLKPFTEKHDLQASKATSNNFSTSVKNLSKAFNTPVDLNSSNRRSQTRKTQSVAIRGI
ncbi:hypothetical protein ACHAWF_002299, partial [Thalassiosira exigua]